MAAANRPLNLFDAIALVVRNNVAAVDANLVAAGYPTGDDSSRNESLTRLLSEDPDGLLRVLSVPMLPERMTPEERGRVLSYAERANGAPIARAGIFPGTGGDPTEGAGAISIDSPPQDSGEGSGWSWNNFAELIVGAGLTVYLNETGGNDGGNGGSYTPPPPRPMPAWMPWAIGGAVVLVAAALWYFTRKRK